MIYEILVVVTHCRSIICLKSIISVITVDSAVYEAQKVIITFSSNFLNSFMRSQHDLFLQCVLEENLSRRAEHYFSEMKRVAKGELITCLVYAFRCI
jgi:hypothetical protein